jgi:AcrR family transcriptional regulator
MHRILAPVNTVVYGEMSHGTNMSDQLSAKDWVDQGLKALASRGFTALKAEPLAKTLRVSRGSFYWHFADIAAFHAAILAASVDPAARAAVQAIDRRRLNYVEGLLAQSGLAAELARARAQILYWAFLGFALSDQPLPKARQQAVLDELLRIAAS